MDFARELTDTVLGTRDQQNRSINGASRRRVIDRSRRRWGIAAPDNLACEIRRDVGGDYTRSGRRRSKARRDHRRDRCPAA
jgi:hypothetical protein